MKVMASTNLRPGLQLSSCTRIHRCMQHRSARQRWGCARASCHIGWVALGFQPMCQKPHQQVLGLWPHTIALGYALELTWKIVRTDQGLQQKTNTNLWECGAALNHTCRMEAISEDMAVRH